MSEGPTAPIGEDTQDRHEAHDGHDGEQYREDESPTHAIVPVPGSRRTEEPRRSFWRRIAMRSLSGGGLSGPTRDDRILARLDALAAQVGSTDQHVEALERRFREVWEVEEQLSLLAELREIALDLQERQGRIDGRLRSLARRLGLITGLAGAAVVAALAALVAVLL